MKDKIKFTLILISSIVAAVLIVSIISGRLSTDEIIIVKKEGLNVNIPLDEQLEFFETKEFSKSELSSFGDSVVKDFSQLAGKLINVNLSVGSPIPVDILVDPDSGGQFATNLNQGQTVHMLSDAANGLPPIEKGDRINVGLTFTEKNELGENVTISSILFYDLKVINKIGSDVYVQVDFEQSLVLFTASSIGNFFYQLPGQREIPYCNDIVDVDIDQDAVNEDTNTSENDESNNLNNEENEVVNEEEHEEEIDSLDKAGQSNIDCLPEDYLPGEVKQSDILNKIKKGESLNESDIEIYRKMKIEEEFQKRNQTHNNEEQNENDEDDDNISRNANTYKIGDSSEVYGLNIKLNSVKPITGNEYDSNINDQLIALDVSIENTSHENQIVSSLLNASLNDEGNTSYKPTFETDASTNFLDGTINSGETIRGDIVFDVPFSDSYEFQFEGLTNLEKVAWKFDSDDIIN